MSDPVKLPELCRQSLLALYAKAQDAKTVYDIAAGHALAALGFDPRADNRLNLDTGEVTPPDAPKE